MIPQKKSAQVRIKESYLELLRQKAQAMVDPDKLKKTLAAIDAHLRYYCSFYDPAVSLPDSEKMRAMLSWALCDRQPTVSVTAIAKEAGVNRATFYRSYPNVTALYNDCCEDVINAFLAVPVPKKRTPATMNDYGSALWTVMVKHMNDVGILFRRTQGDVLIYEIAERLCENMKKTLTARECNMLMVQENLSLFPLLFSTWYGIICIEVLFPNVYPDRNLPAFDPTHSFLENVADTFAKRFGGEQNTYYALNLAVLKLLPQQNFWSIGVSDLSRASGYTRATFYVHFRNAEDFMLKDCDNCVMQFISSTFWFVNHIKDVTPDLLHIYRKEMIGFPLDGFMSFLQNGDVIYLLSIASAYLMRMILHGAGGDRETQNGPLRMTALYFIAYGLRMLLLCCLGQFSPADLQAHNRMLYRIKKQLGPLRLPDIKRR